MKARERERERSEKKEEEIDKIERERERVERISVWLRKNKISLLPEDWALDNCRPPLHRLARL